MATLRSRIEVLEQQVRQSQPASQVDADGTPSQVQSASESVPSATLPEQPLSIISQRFLPSSSVTRQAVEGYFSSSGKLFHIFTRPQISVFMDSVWKNVDNGSLSWKADVCCITAIAAVGIQYTDTTGDTDADTFYEISKVHLDSVLEMRPLDAIKICTLLCMYNLMSGKAVASLVYGSEDPHYALAAMTPLKLNVISDCGLALGRRFGLYNSQRCQLPSLTDSMWVDYRRAWCTLVFVST